MYAARSSTIYDHGLGLNYSQAHRSIDLASWTIGNHTTTLRSENIHEIGFS